MAAALIDEKGLADVIADLIGHYVDQSVAPLTSRIENLERAAAAPRAAPTKPRIRVRADMRPSQ